MSAMKTLSALITHLREVADDIESLAGAVEADHTTPPDAPVTEQTSTTDVSLEQVRAAMAAKSRAGHTKEMSALLKKHGVQKLSQLDPTHYPVLLIEVEAVG